MHLNSINLLGAAAKKPCSLGWHALIIMKFWRVLIVKCPIYFQFYFFFVSGVSMAHWNYSAKLSNSLLLFLVNFIWSCFLCHSHCPCFSFVLYFFWGVIYELLLCYLYWCYLFETVANWHGIRKPLGAGYLWWRSQ